jgi:hypothetical protein
MRLGGTMPGYLLNPIGCWLARLSSLQAILFGNGFLVALSFIDFPRSIEASYSIFYLIPNLVVGWHSTLRTAILMSFVSALLWS